MVFQVCLHHIECLLESNVDFADTMGKTQNLLLFRICLQCVNTYYRTQVEEADTVLHLLLECR